MSNLHIFLLGSLNVTVDGAPVTQFRSSKERALLAYLAEEAQQPQDRRTLIGLLWPELPERAALNNLSQTLSRLRRRVEPGSERDSPFVATRQAIQLPPAPGVRVDTAELIGHVRAAEALRHEAQPAGGRAETPPSGDEATQLETAIGLYRDEFLAGFSLAGCEEFEMWLLLKREEYQQLMLTQLGRLTGLHLDRGRYADAQRVARRHLALEPWAESAHGQLMRALALDGQRAAALKQYETCRQLLWEELGVDPEATTVQLFEQIQRGEVVDPSSERHANAASAPLVPAASEAELAPDARKHNLPASIMPFLGRAAEVEALVHQLRDLSRRLVTVVGMGGVGKTRLVLAAAHELVDHFADGVWFVPLAGLASHDARGAEPNASSAPEAHQSEQIAIAVGDALGIQFVERGAPVAQLFRYVRQKELLLVLDNFEPLLAEAEFAQTLLQKAPAVSVLVTSRVALQVQAESVFRLHGLPVPHADDRAAVEESSAVRLFLDRARRAFPGFTLQPDALAAVTQICALVDGLPLGIELAASWVGHFSVAEIAEAIQANFNFLTTAQGDVPQRQHSVRAVFEYAWQSLSPTEQTLLAEASLFLGEFARDALLTVTAASLLDLARLVERNLLQLAESGGRYRIHDLLRQFASEKLALHSPNQIEQLQLRFSDYYLALAASQYSGPMREATSVALGAIEQNLPNIRQAWQWAVENEQWESIHRSVEALANYFPVRGLTREGNDTFCAAMQRLETISCADSAPLSDLYSQLATARAHGLNYLGRHEDAIALARKAIDHAERTANEVLQADSMLVWGVALMLQGNYESAAHQLHGALHLARAVPAHASGHSVAQRVVATSNLAIGNHYKYQGILEKAGAHYQSALDTFRQLKDVQGEGRALNSLGTHCESQGLYEQAMGYYEQGLTIATTIPDRLTEGILYMNLGVLHSRLGSYEVARQQYEQALTRQIDTGDDWSRVLTMANLGLLFHHLQANERALQLHQEALALAEEMNHSHLGIIHARLGQDWMGLGRLEEAQQAFERAVALQTERNQHHWAIESTAGLAALAFLRTDMKRALGYVEEILEYLAMHSLHGMREPMLVYATCCRILLAVHHEQANPLLREGYDLLHTQVNKIDSQVYRHSFLQNVAANRELVELYSLHHVNAYDPPAEQQDAHPLLPGEKPGAEPGAEPAPEAVQLAAPGHLPPNSIVPHQRNRDFSGRRVSLLRLASLLLPRAEPQKDRTVAITGMAGLGKTQLAVEFCYRYGRFFPGGVYWMSFADPHSVADEIAFTGSERGMGLYGEADGLPVADQIGRVQQAWQDPIPRLLVFDNCESEELLAQWRPVSGGCRVLITSRRGHWERGAALSVHPLPVLDRPESVAVLQQLAPGLQQEEAEAIAAELGDYPLALHLTGSFLQRYQHVSAAAYLTQLRDDGLLNHPALQGHGVNYSPTGHEVHIARTFAVNAEQLNLDREIDQMAQRLLAAVACFAPGEPLSQPLLHTLLVGEDDLSTSLLVQDGLIRLASLGLLQVKGHESVVLHRLLAAYVEGVLLAPAGLDDVRIAVEKRLIALLRDQNQGLYGLATLPMASIHLRHITERARPRSDHHATQLLMLRGCHQRDRGSYEAAERSFRSALQRQEQVSGLEAPERLELLDRLGNLYMRMGRYRAGLSCFEEYLTHLKRSPGVRPLRLARVLHQQGRIHAFLGKFELAQEQLEQSIALYREHLRPDQSTYEYHLANLAVLHLWRGAYETAQPLLERNLRAVEDLLGVDHLELTWVLNSLGECLFCLGRIEEALTAYERALNIQQKQDDLQHLQTAHSLMGLGQIMVARSQLAEAQQHMEDALLIWERILGARHKYVALNLASLGELHLKAGRFDAAKEYLDRGFDFQRAELGAEHPDTAQSLILLGEWHLLARNDEAKAKRCFEQARRTLEKQVVPTHVGYQRVQHNLAALAAQESMPLP